MSDVAATLRAAGCVWAEDEARALLTAADEGVGSLESLVGRRVAGEPLEQVVGSAWLCGVRVVLDPGVFVPRVRSELAVRVAVDSCPPRAVVVDLCCGSGALGLAVATRADVAELHAVDVDPVAVACAARNLAAVGGVAHVGDVDAGLPADLHGRVDVVIANAPYVPSAEVDLLPREARLHEPRPALDGGPDGLAVQRRVIATAPTWLAPGGAVVVETGRHQADLTAAAMATAGLDPHVVVDDDLEATVVVGTVPGTPRPDARC